MKVIQRSARNAIPVISGVGLRLVLRLRSLTRLFMRILSPCPGFMWREITFLSIVVIVR